MTVNPTPLVSPTALHQFDEHESQAKLSDVI